MGLKASAEGGDGGGFGVGGAVVWGLSRGGAEGVFRQPEPVDELHVLEGRDGFDLVLAQDEEMKGRDAGQGRDVADAVAV